MKINIYLNHKIKIKIKYFSKLLYSLNNLKKYLHQLLFLFVFDQYKLVKIINCYYYTHTFIFSLTNININNNCLIIFVYIIYINFIYKKSNCIFKFNYI